MISDGEKNLKITCNFFFWPQDIFLEFRTYRKKKKLWPRKKSSGERKKNGTISKKKRTRKHF